MNHSGGAETPDSSPINHHTDQGDVGHNNRENQDSSVVPILQVGASQQGVWPMHADDNGQPYRQRDYQSQHRGNENIVIPRVDDTMISCVKPSPRSAVSRKGPEAISLNLDTELGQEIYAPLSSPRLANALRLGTTASPDYFPKNIHTKPERTFGDNPGWALQGIMTVVHTVWKEFGPQVRVSFSMRDMLKVFIVFGIVYIGVNLFFQKPKSSFDNLENTEHLLKMFEFQKSDPENEVALMADLDVDAFPENQAEEDCPEMKTKYLAKEIETMHDDEFRCYIRSRIVPGIHISREHLFGMVSISYSKRVVTSQRLNSTYCPISRTASVAWRYMFRKFTGVASFANLEEMWNAEKHGLTLLFEMKQDELEKWGLSPDNFYFVFVRNPYIRLLAFYLEKIKGGNPDSEEFLGYMEAWKGPVFVRVQKRSKQGFTIPSFEEFVKVLYKYKDHLNHRHEVWFPQHKLCYIGILKYFVGHYETLEADVAVILRKWGVAMNEFPSQEDLFMRSTNAERVASEYYTPEAKELVYKMYQRDFEILGYDKDSV